MSKTVIFIFCSKMMFLKNKTWFVLFSFIVPSGALCMDAILCQGPLQRHRWNFFFIFFNSFPNLQAKGKPFLSSYLSLNFYAFEMSQLVDFKISGTIKAYTSCFFHSLQSQGIWKIFLSQFFIFSLDQIHKKCPLEVKRLP